MKHPILESVSQSFKSIQERKVSSREYGSEGLTKSKYVYIFQREYATVHPGLVDVCKFFYNVKIQHPFGLHSSEGVVCW